MVPYGASGLALPILWRLQGASGLSLDNTLAPYGASAPIYTYFGTPASFVAALFST